MYVNFNSFYQDLYRISQKLVYKIPYRRARAWPSGCIVQPLGRVRRASKGILHTTQKPPPLLTTPFADGPYYIICARCISAESAFILK